MSPRRFNKINNNILWSSIHYIIKTLSLQVKLLKIKAHSGNHFNDIVDIQAKLGHTQPIPTTILHDHLLNQTITLSWNKEIPLNKDVCKCINSTKSNLIDWALSSKWFHFNGRNDTTSPLHSKDLKWRIRCSTLTLPTLDIMNRNSPLLIKDHTQCLLCNNTVESNVHLWECPEIYERIRIGFIALGDKLIDLLSIHANKLVSSITDSVQYSNTFRWAYRSKPIHPVALFLLKSYISNDLCVVSNSKLTFGNIDMFTSDQRVAAAISRIQVIDNNRDLERGYINPFNDF
ncbi:hypothetical protein RhiirA5_422927 [Rhizophagus irregularis]|uniref:RNase H type-1 domain-containing protein n=1 Tax=Rhizophagus irregularis TaxID=588596 RepID=A0A2N0PB02_9GLOM|nr:hypothetical protein RhiirA5_422927 [Rhizophagus irregularis]